MKICTKCGTEKDLEEFALHPKGKQGRNPACRQCLNLAATERYERVTRNTNLLRSYGISLDDYTALLKKQNYKCAVCLREYTTQRKLVVDHDHETGKIRGLLCHYCNRGLGLLGDTRESVERVLEYLKNNGSVAER